MTVRRRLLVVLVAGLLLVLLAAVSSLRDRPRLTSPLWIFEVDLRAGAGTFAQLFWGPEVNFVEEHSARKPIHAGGPGQTLRFMIPRSVRWLRFDPADAAGDVVIGRMTLRDADGRILATFAAEDLTSPHDVASITGSGSQMLILASGNNPSVILSVGCLASEVDGGAGWPFSAASLVLASMAALGVLAACFCAIGFDLLRAIRDGTLQSSARWGWIWLPVVFLLVFSAKLLLMRQFPATVPNWDQWDGEARGLYLPYYNCGLTWAQMFALHNEHRIFFSRLLALGLLVLNEQWDPRLQQVVNAGMHSLIAVMLLAIFWRGLESRRLDLLALLILPVFALPYAWENTLMGFQSAFYLLVLFSLPGLWLTTAFQAGSHRWWLGWLCAGCSLFTVAGGVILPVIIAGIALLKIRDASTRRRELALTLSAAVPVLIVGFLAASPPLAGHAPLRPTTVGMFLSAFGRNLAWPWVDHPLAAILMWMPIAAFVAIRVIRRRSLRSLELFVIGLAGWVFGQAAAIAYGRGIGALPPTARYQDVLSLGFVANTLILVVAARQMGSRGLAKGLATVLVIGWSVAALAGLDTLITRSIATLNFWRPHWEAQALNVRRFVLSGDAQELRSRPPIDVPYPSADSLIDALEQPILRRLLPAAFRRPVRVQPRTVTNDAFVPYGAFPTTPDDPMRAGWGSFTAIGNPSLGDFESQEITGCERGGHLSVPVAGYLGLRDLYLAVRSVSTGKTHEIRPDRLAQENWVDVIVPCPEGSFVMIGVDRRPDYWFAFREPVETSVGSVRAERLIEGSFRLMLGALAVLIVALKIT